jgi:hypothetical protein
MIGAWGSRGRGFESRRPDSVRVSAGHELAEALFAFKIRVSRLSMPLMEPLTRQV